jgi:hypothetical protein
MSVAAIAVPIAAGAIILGATFASVPREDRAVEWPLLGGVAVLTAAVAVVLLRRGGMPFPPARKVIPEAGAVVIPMRLVKVA